MQNVLIVITKERFSSNKTNFALDIAKNIQKKGNPTTIFLIEDGVYLAIDREIDELLNIGITIHAEKWDIKARGLKNKINEHITINSTEDLFNEIYEKNEKSLWF
ncbi:MAG: DsrH/TusB family sulfur metabolism protein [Candidatus Helarchaeota archaeon]